MNLSSIIDCKISGHGKHYIALSPLSTWPTSMAVALFPAALRTGLKILLRANDKINQMVHIYVMENYLLIQRNEVHATTRMNLEDIMLRSQTGQVT
jgi:hypothetical protein